MLNPLHTLSHRCLSATLEVRHNSTFANEKKSLDITCLQPTRKIAKPEFKSKSILFLDFLFPNANDRTQNLRVRNAWEKIS